jgi:hypothetical protein
LTAIAGKEHNDMVDHNDLGLYNYVWF